MLKRTLCAVLALVMLICAFPLAALADEAAIAGSGSFQAAMGDIYGSYYTMEETENNSSRSKADFISNHGTEVHGWVGHSDDKYDFFKIKLDKPYQIILDGIGANDAIKFRLTNSSGSVLKTASNAGYVDGTTYPEYTLTYDLAPGTYYIRVTASTQMRAEYYFLFWLIPAVDAPEVTTSNKASSGKPVLKWDAVDGAKNYRIYRATSKDGTYSYLDSTTKTSFTDTTAKAGRKYYYKVKTMAADSDNANSKYSSVVAVTCDCARPDVWLTHHSTTGKNIVKWKEIYGAKEYKVYVSTSKTGTYKCIGTTTKLQLVHSSGASNKMYYYKVKAINEKTSAANSAYSVIVNQKTK